MSKHTEGRGMKKQRPKKANTTFSDRFSDAVEILCGAKPPQKLVTAWLRDEDIYPNLQNWILGQKIPIWAQGIVLLDAAELMASTPVEGVGYGVHFPRTRAEGGEG